MASTTTPYVITPQTEQGDAAPKAPALEAPALLAPTGASDAPSEETLLRIRPARAGEFSLLSFQNVLEALGEDHIFSLEICSVPGETLLLIRTIYPERVVQLIQSHYPGVEIEWVTEEDDPARLQEGESGWRQVMRPDGDEWLPFQVYDEHNALEKDDPFLDVLGGIAQDTREGERLVSRMILCQQPHDWSEAWRARGMTGAGSENQMLNEAQRREQNILDRSGETKQHSSTENAMPFDMLLLCAAIAAAALVALGFWIWKLYQNNQMLMIAGVVTGALLLVGGITYFMIRSGAFRKKEEAEYYDPMQVAIRISGAAFQVEVHIFAFLTDAGGNSRSRASQLLDAVAGAYRGFDNPLGCRFAVEEMNRVVCTAQSEDSKQIELPRGCVMQNGMLLEYAEQVLKKGLFKEEPKIGIIGVREAAALWHLPGESAEVAALDRAQFKRTAAPSAVHGEGALVGVEKEGSKGVRFVTLPSDVMNRHHLYVARTRMGKSTLMGHVAGEIMSAKDRGVNDDALVVIDPHSDLVHEILDRVPRELADNVALLDLGGMGRSVGINLLDTEVFPDRDSAVSAVIEVAKGTWENWGNRMEIILTNSLKSLYEANGKLVRHRQLTMLDAALMLSDEAFREAVLDMVDDPYLLDWWRGSHGGWSDDYGKDAVAPVLTRLSNYSGSEVVRAVLGQRRCTLNMRSVIESGNILLVNTNQSAVGPEVASLVGASVLKLVDTIVRKQGEMRESDDRRKVTLVVDEMQSLQGVDFQGILSEVGKFGGNLIMATQSLSRLDEHSPTMRDAILANIGVLVCFQVNAIDADRLLPELRSEYLTESDITGLPVHNCYVRITSGGTVHPPFTMEVLPPYGSDNETEGAVEKESDNYSRPTKDVLDELGEGMEGRVAEFRRSIRESREAKRNKDDSSYIDLSQYAASKTRGRRRSRRG